MKKIIIITRVEKSRKDIATRWRNARLETKYREYMCDSESDEDIGGPRALGNTGP